MLEVCLHVKENVIFPISLFLYVIPLYLLILSLIVIYYFITGSSQETLLTKDSLTDEFSHFPKLCMLGNLI